MYVLAIVGSPRKGKATDLLIDRAIEGVFSRCTDAQIKKLYLADYKISHCTNCLSCRDSNTGKDLAECTIRDDMDNINQFILDSDGIIVGNPLHMGSVTSLLSTFLGRICWTFAKPEGKVLTIKRVPIPRTKKKRKSIIIITNSLVPPVYKILTDSASPLIKGTLKSSLNSSHVGGLFAGDLETRGVESYYHKAYKLGEKLCKSL